jgi:hypothetical protein
LERFERLVVARAAVLEEPGQFFEQQMQAFEQSLDFDPDDNEHTRAERRMREWMDQEAA